MATILVVDDKTLNRSVLTTLLGYTGHRLLEAATGPEALDKVRMENPELIITDILMPDMDGYELARRVRALPAVHQPQIIFYSATYLQEEALTLARACGVSRVLCKPCEPEEVLKVVGETLASDRSANSRTPEDKLAEGEAVKVLSNKLYHKVRELEELNGELERRVAERTADLEKSNRSLQQEIVVRQRAETEAAKSNEERLKMKGEFLSHVSHELRSPLAVVHQFTTILLDGLGGPLSSDQHEYLGIALRNINQLKCMIDDLLDTSRADVGKLSLRCASISIADVISQTVKSYRSIAARKEISLDAGVAEDLPLVHADPARVSQILTNLLDNAIKFSPPKTTITVRAGRLEDDPHFLCVSVADRGCGLKPEEAGRVFERLYQAEKSMKESRHGLGLGLYICKELIGLHRGRIWVDTNYGVGSTFRFTLPISTIESMIGPLLLVDGRLAPSAALITVKVSPREGWRDERQRERALFMIHQLLERCVLPDLDVLLPTQAREGVVLFSIVARADERGAQVLLSRIREQLSRCEDLKDWGMSCSPESEVIDLQTLTNGLILEQSVIRAANHLSEKLNISLGANLDEHQQQNTSG